MSVLFLLIPLSVLLAACFLGAFIWAVRSGQYEDTCTPAMRPLMHDAPPQPGLGVGRAGAKTGRTPLTSAGPEEPGHSPIRTLNRENSHS